MRRWVMLLAMVAADAGAANQDAVIVLHARPLDFAAPCTAPQQAGFNCSGDGAQTLVAPSSDLSVFVYTYRADSLRAIALRFDWDQTWSLYSWQGNCQEGWVEAVTPTESGGSLVAAFNCVTTPPPAPGLIPVGKLNIRSGASGTFLRIGNAIGPDSTAVLSCTEVTTAIPSGHWGSIGVNSEGVDGCQIAPSGGWGGGDDMF